jgi:hypothetical protein
VSERFASSAGGYDDRDSCRDPWETLLDMVEKDFWLSLEFRICSEFAGFEDKRLRHYWCDGLCPEEYDLQAEEPCVRGLAYCGQSGQERWRFTLLLGASVCSQTAIDWSLLLPADHVTGWLSPHPLERTLIIDPLSAYAD